MQSALKRIADAQRDLAAIRLQTIADIRRRLPNRPARRRASRAADFQI
jgi:hypothetical protein